MQKKYARICIRLRDEVGLFNKKVWLRVVFKETNDIS